MIKDSIIHDHTIVNPLIWGFAVKLFNDSRSLPQQDRENPNCLQGASLRKNKLDGTTLLADTIIKKPFYRNEYPTKTT
jgi:hypothetical protein